MTDRSMDPVSDSLRELAPASTAAGTPAATPAGTPPNVAPDAVTRASTREFSPAVATPDAATPAAELPAGATVGKYRILEPIRGGGMGFVYRAYNPDLKCEVALKVLRAGELAGLDELRRFALECEALAKFRHPHIVAVHDASQHQGQPFLVMEYLRGGSLAAQMTRFQSDPRAAVALMEKVARAVEHLHAGGILHRDLKPANVLLDEAGEPRVSDFGLVKLLDSGDDLTRTGLRPGTPPYMAPEQTEMTAAPLSAATDVWALGVVLYELLVGRRPFNAGDRSALFRQIATRDPELPRKLRPDLDPDLQAVLLKCLQKHPAQRFAAAGELADELSRWLKGEPTRTRPERRLHRVARAVRRRPMVTAALLLFALLAAVAAVAVWHHDPDRPNRQLCEQIAQGQPIQIIGEQGWPHASRWLLNDSATATLDHQGFYTISALERGALLELVHDLPVASYRVRAKVRHNKSLRMGSVGIYLSGAAAKGPSETVALFLAMRYNGIIDIAQNLRQELTGPKSRRPANVAPVVIPEGNPVTLHGALRIVADRAEPWEGGLGGASGRQRLTPTGVDADGWRDLEILVRPGFLQASVGDIQLYPLNLQEFDASVRRQLGEAIETQPGRRALLERLPARFDPAGSIGLYVADGSASFAEFAISPD